MPSWPARRFGRRADFVGAVPASTDRQVTQSIQKSLIAVVRACASLLRETAHDRFAKHSACRHALTLSHLHVLPPLLTKHPPGSNDIVVYTVEPTRALPRPASSAGEGNWDCMKMPFPIFAWPKMMLSFYVLLSFVQLLGLTVSVIVLFPSDRFSN